MTSTYRVLIPYLLLAIANASPATAAEPPITATTSQQVHPVLLRNDQNELLEIVIDVKTTNPVQLRAIHVSFDGTDDLRDLETAEIRHGEITGTFASSTSIATASVTANTLKWKLNQPLDRGPNKLWLSCKLNSSANPQHKITANCTTIETTAGIIQPVQITPAHPHRIGVALRKHNDDQVHTYRIPALSTTRAGTLLCAYDMRRRSTRDLQGDIDIGLSRSTNGGRSWESPRVIMDMGEYNNLPQSQNGCGDPGILVDRTTGEIFCFATWMNGKPGKHQWTADGSEPGFNIGASAQFLMVRSHDDGRTWTKPENLTRSLKKPEWWLLAPSPQQGITLPNGTLVMPIQGRDSKGSKFSTIMYSRNHGASWTVGSPAYIGGSECQAARLGDNSIMLNIRNDNERFRAVFTTRDLGQTWQPHPTNRNTLIEPTCNASLLRVDLPPGPTTKPSPSHLLLFANPHSTRARTHQTIQVSLDDGQSWPKELHHLLDEGKSSGYPSLTRIDDNRIGIVYEGSQANLVFETRSITELQTPRPAPAGGNP